jgi:hypothetical protein
MTALAWLDRMVGADRAELWIRDRTRAYVDLDHLAPDTAQRLVLEQADAGDPLLLASPGQVWALPDDVDPEEADLPARRVLVYRRLEAPPRVEVRLLGDGTTPATRDELLIDVLRDYTLRTWTWWNDLEEQADHTDETNEETTGPAAPHDGPR